MSNVPELETSRETEAHPKVLTRGEILNVRAYERTFYEAYWRTSLTCFGTAIAFIRVFTSEFQSIGWVFIALGLAFLGISLWRSIIGSHVTAIDTSKPFKTSGEFVMMTFIVSLVAFIVSFVMVLLI